MKREAVLAHHGSYELLRYFRQGSRALLIGYSTCCDETRRGRMRSLAMAGKLFPTSNPHHATPLKTAHFITQQDLGGARADYINDAELRNEVAFLFAALRGLEQEPRAALRLVDEILEQARGGDVVVLFGDLVGGAHIGRERLVVVHQLAQHRLRRHKRRVVVFDPLKLGDVPDRQARRSPRKSAPPARRAADDSRGSAGR